jgi:hypothetical protein
MLQSAYDAPLPQRRDKRDFAAADSDNGAEVAGELRRLGTLAYEQQAVRAKILRLESEFRSKDLIRLMRAKPLRPC